MVVDNRWMLVLSAFAFATVSCDNGNDSNDADADGAGDADVEAGADADRDALPDSDVEADSPDAEVDADESGLTLSVDPELLVLEAGDIGSISVTIERLGGFGGAVEVTAEDLPEGVTAAPLSIGPEETSGSLFLTAEATAPQGRPATARVEGSADPGPTASSSLVLLVGGPPGTLDTSFSFDGWHTTDFGGEEVGHAVVVQDDGKVIVGGSTSVGNSDGDFALARYNLDGTLDETFGLAHDGRVRTDMGSHFDSIQGLALDGEGRIVTTGRAGSHMALARYLTDGTLDESFNGTGRAPLDFGDNYGAAYAADVDTEGRILVGGLLSLEADYDGAIVRVLEDGSPDETYGSEGAGYVVTDLGTRADTYFDIHVQADGVVVAVGYTFNGAVAQAAAARYLADGTLDTLLSGQALPGSPGWDDYLRGVLVLPEDGSIIMAGESRSNPILAKLLPGGSYDSDFGVDGMLTIPGAENTSLRGITLHPDGRIVAVAAPSPSSVATSHVVLLDEEDGLTPDSVLPLTEPTESAAVDVAIDPYGRIVVAGYTYSGSINTPQDFLVYRFWP